MAPKKGGLGKGLNALFADNAIDESEATVQLRIEEIEPNRNQPRKEFDEAALAELDVYKRQVLCVESFL